MSYLILNSHLEPGLWGIYDPKFSFYFSNFWKARYWRVQFWVVGLEFDTIHNSYQSPIYNYITYISFSHTIQSSEKRFDVFGTWERRARNEKLIRKAPCPGQPTLTCHFWRSRFRTTRPFPPSTPKIKAETYSSPRIFTPSHNFTDSVSAWKMKDLAY